MNRSNVGKQMRDCPVENSNIGLGWFHIMTPLMLVSLCWVDVFFVGILLGGFCWRMFVDGCFPIPTRFSQIFFLKNS